MDGVPKNTISMHEIADRYAAELQAQFRTLNLFVKHGGEIGRAHEVFIRGVLSRFLPQKLRCGTGFVSNSHGVSRQQDIIIYDAHLLPLLFEVGDCIVADSDAVAATLEVKTAIKSIEDLTKALDGVAEAKRWFSGFAGVYIWDGPSLDMATSVLWDRFRAAKPLGFNGFPDAIYVSGKYMIVPNYDGAIDTNPLRLLEFRDGGENSQGAGLLTLVERMWISGLQTHAQWPHWLSGWASIAAERCEAVHWPKDLLERAIAERDRLLAYARP